MEDKEDLFLFSGLIDPFDAHLLRTYCVLGVAEWNLRFKSSLSGHRWAAIILNDQALVGQGKIREGQ